MNKEQEINTPEYQATLKKAANILSELFPKTDKDPVYSLGFQRWQKLGRKKQQALMIRHNFDYNACINELQNL